jgi:hypothetical protein
MENRTELKSGQYGDYLELVNNNGTFSIEASHHSVAYNLSESDLIAFAYDILDAIERVK